MPILRDGIHRPFFVVLIVTYRLIKFLYARILKQPNKINELHAILSKTQIFLRAFESAKKKGAPEMRPFEN